MSDNKLTIKVPQIEEVTPDNISYTDTTSNTEINLHQPCSTISNDESQLNTSTPSIIVYGNDIKINSPCKMGGVYTFLFRDGEPLIVIGKQGRIKTIIITKS
jgi:hypothetical protein